MSEFSDQLERLVESELDEATESVCERAEMLVRGGQLTMEEAEATLRGYIYFADAWQDWIIQAEEEGEPFWPPVSDPPGTVAG